MTGPLFAKALAAGAGQVAIWSQLLDRINVFPVADGDTGRNLVISLAPLKQQRKNPEELCRSLLFAARGNSGNIAVRFLQELIAAPSTEPLAAAVQRGRDQAYEAVQRPEPGTMLTLFDRLAELCGEKPPHPADSAWTGAALSSLEQTVAETAAGQPLLRQAGVVDAGCLGMYLFFDGFFSCLAGADTFFSPERARFKDRLSIKGTYCREPADGFCIDAVLESGACPDAVLGPEAESAVIMRSGGQLKVHVHALDRQQAKAVLGAYGKIISWSEDDLAAQTALFAHAAPAAGVHIMTDAAGSITREDAAGLGITLLDSYVTIGEASLPETCCEAATVYSAMRRGLACSTAQASADERRRHYGAALGLYPCVVYLCVGSAYTGNFETARAWQRESASGNRFTVIDTGTASGRLAVAVHLAAKKSRQAQAAPEVEAYVRQVLGRCHEYIFIDTLKYLAAGGRISKTGAFFGDMLNYKPVISPQPDGAQRTGMAKNRDEQIRFALRKLERFFRPDGRGLILLQYSDNRGSVEETAATVQARFPKATVLVRPVSLTTGVHTGPGTWAAAFAPDA